MPFSGISSVLPGGGSHSLIQLVFTECLLEPTAGAHGGARCKGEARNGGEGSFPGVDKLPTDFALFSVACLQAWVSAGQVFAFHPVACH